MPGKGTDVEESCYILDPYVSIYYGKNPHNVREEFGENSHKFKYELDHSFLFKLPGGVLYLPFFEKIGGRRLW